MTPAPGEKVAAGSSSTSPPPLPEEPRPTAGGRGIGLNPRRVLADLNVYSKSYFRSPEALFFTLFFPFLLVLMFGAIFSGSGTSAVPIYVQNLDGGNGTTMWFYHALQTNDYLTINNVTLAPGENMSTYLAKNSYSEGLVIPPGFGEQLYGERYNVSHGLPAGYPVRLAVFTAPVDPAAQGVVETVVGDALNAYQNGATVPFGVAVNLPVTSTTFVPKEIDYEVPGLIGFAILINPMFAMVSLTSEYKRDKLFKALSLTPLTRGEWLGSKILWHWVMSFLSAGILIATGVLVFGAHILLGPLIIVFLLLGPLFFVSLGMLVGTLSKKAETAAFIGNLVTFPMMFLSGAFIPVQEQPAWLQPYAQVWPLYYVISGIQDISVFNNTPAALVDIAIVAVMSAITFVAAISVFKWREE